MHKIKFFKDFANIMDWAYTQHQGCQDGTDQTKAYVADLEPMEKFNDKLFKFFWDAETSTYRYPTEEEIEDSKDLKIDRKFNIPFSTSTIKFLICSFLSALYCSLL